ncbi:hypothetical protein GCM10023205_52650 [Yinghuangia aomiensis]|uniref:HTH cro/C1-type domain-containing protein n=1 Tax=Yinghuangia aomiensis TaxID=676205 RepID=A0ABP9HTU8_9ACTN
MGQRRRDLTPDASPLAHWGSELRAWRDRRGMSLTKLGELVRYNASYLAKVERAERKPSAAMARACDDALGANEALWRLWEKIERAEAGGDGRGHVASSSGHVASSVATLDVVGFDPGPSDEEVTLPCRTADGRIVYVSLPRRAFIGMGMGLGAAAAAAPAAFGAPQVSPAPAVVHRAANANPVQHLNQLRMVLIDSDNMMGPRPVIPTVEAQLNVIYQLRQEHTGADGRALAKVHAEYAEFAGWLYQDAGELRTAQYWTDRALELSHTAGDHELAAYVMARKSQLAGDARDPLMALDMAQAASGLVRPRSRLEAVCATYAAHGFALRGDTNGCLRSLDEARTLLTRLDDDPSSPWGVWLDAPYIEVQRARCLADLGQHAKAAEAFRAEIDRLPAGFHRDRGVYLAREAAALAGCGEPEQAAAIGMQALAVAADTQSARIVRELVTLDTSLAAWSGVPAVGEFRESFDASIVHQA